MIVNSLVVGFASSSGCCMLAKGTLVVLSLLLNFHTPKAKPMPMRLPKTAAMSGSFLKGSMSTIRRREKLVKKLR